VLKPCFCCNVQIYELQESSVPWMALIGDIALAALTSFKADGLTADLLYKVVDSARSQAFRPDLPALAAAMELHQRSEGFDPMLSAADLHLLALYSNQSATIALLTRQPEAPNAQRWLAAGLSANRLLLQLDPSMTACLHCKRGTLMIAGNRCSEAVAAFRAALPEASEHKCE
jgi:hypothetical protein